MTIVATFRYIVATLNVIGAMFGFNVATNQVPPNSQS
ncbi:hypothetical protein C8K15_12623 [Paenisporosarcina sp. OV554]|nr:hypothetical protein C8K15_12623 [Paenisporosarcina sp. OV554]